MLVDMTTTVATKLRNARVGLGLSQDELAAELRQLGAASASKRHVQRWENGVIPGRHYARYLSAIFGVTPDDLGLPAVVEDGDGARHVRAWSPFTPPPGSDAAPASDGRLPGVWLSRYQYFSTGRSGLYISQHHMVLTREGTSVSLDSLPLGVAPAMTINLTMDGQVLTGAFEERTDPRGHYLGERRWGALQLIVTPNRRYMYGKWCAWGSGQRINTGPWELTWITADTSAESLDSYSRALPDEAVE